MKLLKKYLIAAGIVGLLYLILLIVWQAEIASADLKVRLATSSAPTPHLLGVPFLVRYGEKVSISNGSSKELEIQFLSLIEDSRCRYAEKVICKWEGNARVAIRVWGLGSEHKDLELNTASRYQRVVDYSGYQFRLLSVHPRNDEIRGHPPTDSYSIELEIDKLS